MRFFKIVLALIFILIAILLAAPFFLEPNDFKDEISQAVEDATGRKLQITGDLDLSVFPWLGLKTGELQLGNKPGFQGKSFATIKSAQIRVKLVPLLSNKIEMDSLQLDGLDLNLQQLKNGSNNWSDLAAKNTNKKQTSNTDIDAPKVAALAIGGIAIKNSQIRYRDAVTGQDLQLKQLNLETGPLELGAPVSVALSSSLSTAQPAVRGTVNLTTEFKANPFDGTYQLNNSRITADLKGKTLPAGEVKGTLSATIAANLIKQTLKLSNLTLTSDPVTLTGAITATKILSPAPQFAGDISVATFNPRELLNKYNIALPAMADANAFKRSSFDTHISGNASKINLSKLKLILDDSLIQGKVKLINKARQEVNYTLSLDRIDLDRYLPPAAKQTAGFSLIQKAFAAPQPAPLFPVKLLRSFDMAGNVKAGELIMNRLKIENIDVTLQQKRGFLKIEPIKGNAYNGTYLGHIKIDARKQHGNLPIVSANETLTGIDIGPVIKIISGQDALTGKGNVSAVLTTRGQSIPALKQALSGEIKLALADGVLKGIDIVQAIKDTYAQYKNQQTTNDGKQETPFTSMNVSFQIANGIMNSQDLVIRSALPLVRGKGAINLNNNTINYTVKTSLNKELVDAIGIQKELTGVPIRINVKGNLASPAYSVDWLRMIGRVIEKKQKKKLLDSLFGKKKKKSAEPAQQTAPAPSKPETAEEKKRREKEEKKDKIKNLLKGLF